MESFNDFIYRKNVSFGIRIVNLYKYLINNKEFVMSKQILRSGTSIGANVAESKFAQSTADLINKLSIARKEANETVYWLDILHETDFISSKLCESLKADCIELIKLFTSSILSLQSADKD